VEAIGRIKDYYNSPDATGPAWVARFLDLKGEDAAVQKMDVFATMQTLLTGIESTRQRADRIN
jgi:hypothetical protein